MDNQQVPLNVEKINFFKKKTSIVPILPFCLLASHNNLSYFSPFFFLNAVKHILLSNLSFSSQARATLDIQYLGIPVWGLRLPSAKPFE